MIKQTKKRIKILSTGPIWEKAGVMGPILTPYKEDVATIIKLLSDGIKVNEVLNNGKEVPLTFMNCDTVNDEDTLEPATTLQIPKTDAVSQSNETKVDTVTETDADKVKYTANTNDTISLNGNKHNKKNK